VLIYLPVIVCKNSLCAYVAISIVKIKSGSREIAKKLSILNTCTDLGSGVIQNDDNFV